MDTNYLIHYGIPKRSGRYPWGSGKRPFQSGGGREQRISRRADRINKRAVKKMTKLETKRELGQKKADKYFDKAVRRSTSFFSTQRRVNRAVDTAYSAQQKVTRLEQKGKKYYQKIQKKMSRMDKKIDPKVQEMGERYIQYTMNNSKAMYNSLLTGNKNAVRHYRS